MLDRIAGVFQFVQQWEILQSRLPQSPRGFSVTLPRLWLDDDHLRQSTGSRQELLETVVAIIQMDPHGDGEAEHHVESRLIKLCQILPQSFVRLLVLRQKVQAFEGQAIPARIAFARSLDQDRVQIHAD